MKDESHLPVSEQSLVFRLRKRAEIRRQIKDRKSVQEGQADRIADLLEEAAREIVRLNAVLIEVTKHTIGRDNFQS
jgi:vacuolar-type H+-ATPase subunit I/STV1